MRYKILISIIFITSVAFAQNKKISQLPAATTPLVGTEIAEIVQGGVNKKVPVSAFGGGGSVNSVSGTTNRVTSTGGTTPIIDISATFEALLSKIANRIDQNNASTTSSQLATTLSDETGSSGGFVRATSPTLTTPNLGTPSTLVLTNASGLPISAIAPGSANQIIGTNNAGTAAEYKTVSTSSTAVSNDVGVTLSGANALVINVPDASGTVRGVATTSAQSFGGLKTFPNSIITGSTTNGIQVNAGPTITFYSSPGSTNIGFSTSNNFLYSTLSWQLPRITFTTSGNTTDTNAPFITGGSGQTTHQSKFFNNADGNGISLITQSSSAYGNLFTYNNVLISNSLAPITTSTGSIVHRMLAITPTINTSGGTTTVTDLYIAPVETSMTGVTHYGIVNSSTTAKNGFGTAIPSALLHVNGSTRLDLGSDATGDIFYRSSGGNITRLGVGTGNNVLSVSAGIPVWADPVVVYSGNFSQVGTATTVFTVTIGTTQANNTYEALVTPTSALSAALFYVTNKTTTTFDVTYLAGLTGTVTFDWIVKP